MDMFVDSELIEIAIYYRKSGKGNVIAAGNIDELSDDEKKKYSKIIMRMAAMTWKQYNDLQRKALVHKGPGMGDDIDWVTWKESKLLMILKGWDIKDKDGKAVPVNQENIYKLHPQIAEAALSEFDKATMLGEEDRKNS